MLLPAHLILDIAVIAGLDKSGIIRVSLWDWVWLFGSNLIDIDHLFSRPVYVRGRNPFRAHFFHRNWLWVLAAAILMILWRPVLFLGIGLILHLLLDFIDISWCKTY